MEKEFKHTTVLLEESVKYLLNGRTAGIYVDATLGGGGTSEKILEQIDSSGKARVIGIDQDSSAIEMAARRLSPYPNFKPVRANFRDVDKIFKEENIDKVDGVIMDLGVSSMQLEDALRGFSFRLDSKLDMRMDPDAEESAFEIVNSMDEASLKKLFQEYGEDRWAGRVALRIVEARRTQKIETTLQLSELIARSIPKRFHSRRIHPATRFFQALRIAVNQELKSLEEGLEASANALRAKGRIVVISYHSLEDRIVKHKFRSFAQEKNFKIITKKPIIPADDEIKENPRSRSAKMRVLERNDAENDIKIYKIY